MVACAPGVQLNLGALGSPPLPCSHIILRGAGLGKCSAGRCRAQVHLELGGRGGSQARQCMSELKAAITFS